MADDLEARLESHSQAFEGLLSLIPANEYYGKDNSDQWQRKKQTKEEKRAAKRAKLDPENRKSAKDVMDENERKRKRELGMDTEVDGESETPKDVAEGKAEQDTRQNKKIKIDSSAETDDAAKKTARAEKRKEKRQLKKERTEKQKQKTEAKKARKQDNDLDIGTTLGEDGTAGADDDDEDDVDDTQQLDSIDFSGLADVTEEPARSNASSAPSSPDPQSSGFDVSNNQSAASSSSSIVPPTIAPKAQQTAAPSTTNGTNGVNGTSKKEKAFKLPEINPEELQSRLRARIEELRARRKADGPNGQPAKSRQELLDARRKKEEARKQHKKELRLKAKQEEERLNNERLRGSGSPLSVDVFSPLPIDETNFSFGRVAFDGNGEADPNLTSINDHTKRRGPQDTRTALAAAEKKAARLAGYDASKRAEIEQKDLWLNAKKKAHGEKLRNDPSLLKKALKRKEKFKTKSATEWNERIDNVRKGKEMKDKKRSENLAKRKEDKGAKKGPKEGGKSGGGKKKGRPGFEGKFKG